MGLCQDGCTTSLNWNRSGLLPPALNLPKPLSSQHDELRGGKRWRAKKAERNTLKCSAVPRDSPWRQRGAQSQEWMSLLHRPLPLTRTCVFPRACTHLSHLSRHRVVSPLKRFVVEAWKTDERQPPTLPLPRCWRPDGIDVNVPLRSIFHFQPYPPPICAVNVWLHVQRPFPLIMTWTSPQHYTMPISCSAQEALCWRSDQTNG